MTENAQGLTDIGKLVLTFAKVNRATFHEDGKRSESDTDHTVMLSISACALAQKLYPGTLDIGLIAQFALVHDLVEVYAEDTDSFGLKEEAKKEKEKREWEAFLRIKEEFGMVYPWLPETIERYEELDTKEARFVKMLDKLMPKVTHVLNDGIIFKTRGETRAYMTEFYASQQQEAEETWGKDFPEVTQLLEEIVGEVMRRVHGEA